MGNGMKSLTLAPVAGLRGEVHLPGSKSISNRVLLLAALAEGDTVVRGLLDSDDVRYMLEALAALGVTWQQLGDSRDFVVEGCGGALPADAGDFFLGNAGTAMRTLSAALAVRGGDYRVRGIERMHERPIGDLVDAVAQLGAQVEYLGEPGYPPLQIGPRQGGQGGPVRIRGDVSSQFTTGLLQCGPLLPEGLEIEIEGELISKPYVDMTIALMARFGVEVERDGWGRFRVAAGQRYRSPGEIYVEGDASSASYFLAAGLVGGGPVTVHGVGRDSIQGDVAFADVLEAMGAQVQRNRNSIDVCAPADQRVRAFDRDFNAIPDAAMTLAVVALFADGPCTLRNIASWRVKETDRLHAMATELGKLGIEVEQGEDWLRVHPGPVRDGVSIHTYDDHRIAMCFSLVAAAGVSVVIEDPDCTAKTFPGYFDAFATLDPGVAS